MEYSEEYPDWDFSIDMAMQGAIARICHKYHDRIPRTSAYFQFGERTEDGRPFDHTGTDKWSIIHQYMVEREYSEEYLDWDFSIDMAMQGAIARICHKYHDLIPRTSAYFQFGERTEDGRPFDRTGTDKWSIIHQYMVEREYSTVGMEDVLRGQMDGIEKLMDKYDARDKSAVEAQAKIVDLELENVVIQERMSLLEEPLKLEERLICSDVWAEALKKTLLLTIENRTEEAKKREILMSKMEALKMENQALKGTITQLLDERVVEKAPKRKTRQTTRQYLKRFKPVPET